MTVGAGIGVAGVTVEAGAESGGLEPALTVARGRGLTAPTVDRGREGRVEETVGCSGGGRVTVRLGAAVVVEVEVGGCAASTTGGAAVDVRTAGGVITMCWDSEVITQNRAPTTNTPASVSPSPAKTVGLVSWSLSVAFITSRPSIFCDIPG